MKTFKDFILKAVSKGSELKDYITKKGTGLFAVQPYSVCLSSGIQGILLELCTCLSKCQ